MERSGPGGGGLASILADYGSTVDWPSAVWRELAEAYPESKVILTTRSAQSWCDSYLETIHAFMSKADEVPPEVRPWFEMAFAVTAKCGFGGKTSRVEIIRAFEAHADAVRSAIPAERLLVYEVKDGWEPLCAFLGKAPPAAPFPKTNNREEFWELAQMASG